MAKRSAPIKVPTESHAAERDLTCTVPSSELAHRFPVPDPTASAPRFGTESLFRRIVFRLELVENPAERIAPVDSAVAGRAERRREARRDDMLVGGEEREFGIEKSWNNNFFKSFANERSWALGDVSARTRLEKRQNLRNCSSSKILVALFDSSLLLHRSLAHPYEAASDN